MRNESGQTLIEVLAALTAAVVIVAAIVSASLNALNNSEFGRDQNAASQATQEGLELIRNMRNASVASVSATYLPDGSYCLAKSCVSLNRDIAQCWQKIGTYCQQNFDKFVRDVSVFHNSVDCNATPTPLGLPQGVLTRNLKIVVTSSWFDSKCTDATKPYCHSVTSSSCFSDFTIVPTP